MSADSPRRTARGVPAIVPPQVVSDRSIIDSVAGFINDVTLANQPQCDPKDTITWARFESAADISDPRFGEDWELEGNVAPPLLLILGYGQGVQVWAIPANGEAVEVLSWRHGIVTALRVLPTPTGVENSRADEPIDSYADRRPLMAICDGATPAGSNPQFCAVNFISLKTGVQVKTIKFKNPVLDILANRSSVVITFHERIAVFDARNLEDRLSVTTCYPSPGINPNPVALGSRWLAYSENKLLHSKRSGGGCDGDGVSSYTATVLNAAKSFGKGLRELGEQVAAGLTGTTGSGLSSKSSSFDSASGDVRQAGVVTILDIKNPIKDISPTSGIPIAVNGNDPIVAHFIAHSEAVVAMEFDNSGMMLLTADKRGHDFHLFRIQPHPVGSSLAAVHHLYVLHRGDTSAKVQNITFSLDSRWVAVSTLRGTTHVFPITPYGGPAGVRTHTSLHVVNKLSRFHRSAGLTADGRSSSPLSHSDSTNFSQLLMPYHNPTLPPFPRPLVVLPLAQLRQPFSLGSPPGSATSGSYSKGANTRQRLSSLSDDSGKPLSVCAVFAKSRSWLLDPPNSAREMPNKVHKAVDSLFVMAGHGALIQYDLDTAVASNVAKERICDDTPIELDVEAKAQWNLGRKEGSLEIMPPLSNDNWLVKDRNSCMLIDSTRQIDENEDNSENWLAQVEIITHAGPHRRLWMGPQFVFKTYNTPSGSNLSHIDAEAVEIGISSGPATGRPERSSPLNMPLSATGRSAVPVLIESGSYSSIEQSPRLMDRFRHEHMNSDYSVAHGDTRLREDLADAMRESPSCSCTNTGGQTQRRSPSAVGAGSSRATTSSSPSSSPQASGSGGVSSTSLSASATAATAVSPSGTIADTDSSAISYHNESIECPMQQQQQMKSASIEKVVNPLGTVTTITANCDDRENMDDVMMCVSNQDNVIHENCDESLFRPVVAIFCDERAHLDAQLEDEEYTRPPEPISNKLVVPVIEKAVDIELTKREIRKNRGKKQQAQMVAVDKEDSDNEIKVSGIRKKSKGELEINKKPAAAHFLKGILGEEKSAEGESSRRGSIEKTCDLEPKEEKPRKPSLNQALKSQKHKLTGEIQSTPLSEASPPRDKPSDKEQTSKSKLSRSFEKDPSLSEVDSSDKKPEKARKSSVTDVKTKTETDLTKSPLKLRKSEEKEGSPAKSKAKDFEKSLKTKEMPRKPLDSEKIDNPDEKPIEFKRMTISPVDKSPYRSPKHEKYPAIKVEDKTKPKAFEKKTKESSVEKQSTISMPKPLTEVIKTTDKVKSSDQADGRDILEPTISKKKAKELKKKAAEDTKLLEIELSSVSDLADSLLDFVPDKVDAIPLPPIDIDKLKKPTDGSDEKTSASDKKETATKPKSDKTETTPVRSQKPPESIKIEDTPKSKVTTNQQDTIITVEERRIEESDNLEDSSAVLNVSTTQSDAKTKLKKKSKFEKAPVAATKKIPSPERKTKQSVNISQTSSPPITSSPISTEKKPKKDKQSRLIEVSPKKERTEQSSDSPIRSKKENNLEEMTASKVLIEPMQVETFLSDLMDSQRADKSIGSPTDSEKSAVSTKRTVGSPLKFVDSYADNFIKPKTPSPKEKVRKIAIPDNSNPSPSAEIKFFDKFLQDSAKRPATEPQTPWKPVSNVKDKTKASDLDYPALGKAEKSKSKSQKPSTDEIPRAVAFYIDFEDEKEKKITDIGDMMDELPALQPLEELPCDFLELLSPLGQIDAPDDNVSLINFESPLQEKMKPIKPEPKVEVEVEKSSPQMPKGFPSDNIIFALCGSLHYENENSGKPTDSPLTLSFSDSTAHTTAEYKSLTENDDQFLSLEQSSQENAPSTSSSTCDDVTEATYSSGGVDKTTTVTSHTEKAKNKQRRKKPLIAAAPDDDEELRPLISKSDDLMTCSLTPTSKPKTTTPDKAKAIPKKETLPPLDNNQVNSDLSSSDQATTSEDPDDQICLNVTASDVTAVPSDETSTKSSEIEKKSIEEDNVQSPQQQASQSQQQQQPNSSKKKLKRRKR